MSVLTPLGKVNYHLSKILPLNTRVVFSLKNGIRFFVRSNTMDKAIFKEVWIKEIYKKYGIGVEDGDVVFDIGAQAGYFSVYAAELSSKGKVYAFEPFQENFKILEQHQKMNNKSNLFIYNKGVTSDGENKVLYLSSDNTGGHSFFLDNKSNGEVQVETIILSDFCYSNKISVINFLKLDCEGAEFDILFSDSAILKIVEKIVIECHPYSDYTVSMMIQYLEQNGFEVFYDGNLNIANMMMLYARKRDI